MFQISHSFRELEKMAGAISIKFLLLLKYINSKYLFFVSSGMYVVQEGGQARYRSAKNN